MIITLLIFVTILALLVLAHELGHFVVARKNGIRAEEFGIGFPPRLFGIQLLKSYHLEKVAETDTEKVTVDNFALPDGTEVVEEKVEDKIKETDVLVPERRWRFIWGNGEPVLPPAEQLPGAGTIYSLNWIPLGGFVRIKGENGDNTDADSFAAKRIWRRVLVLSAGVAMNVFLAVVLLTIGYIIGLPQSLDNVGWGAKIRDAKVEIAVVLDDSPAAKAGVQAGDRILSVGRLAGSKLANIQTYLDVHKGEKIKFVLLRGDVQLTKEIVPKELAQTKKGGIGVALLETGVVSYPWYLAPWQAVQAVGWYTWEILRALWLLLAGLLRGAGAVENLSGPVGIAILTGRVARLGFSYLLQFTALLSINLAIINILPFPALDGGRILFLTIEKLRGRPVHRKVEGIVHTVGFALLMVLVVFVTYKDVVRFSASFVRLGKKLIGG